MIAKLFDTPVLENGAFQTLASKHKGDTNRLAEYTYTKRWTKPGDFELTLPFDTELLSMLTLNGFICFDDGTENDWLWIQNLTYDGKSITLSGKDCKGLLETRIALYGATQTAGASVTLDPCSRGALHCVPLCVRTQTAPSRLIVSFCGD